jgi:hypothetical protein
VAAVATWKLEGILAGGNMSYASIDTQPEVLEQSVVQAVTSEKRITN